MIDQNKFISSLELAKKELERADHFTYVTLPVVKDNRLLLRVLEGISNSVLNAINAVLQFEYLNKRILIYNNARDNFNTFKSLAGRYNISQEQLATISEILSLGERHKKSPLEFIKNSKIVIISDDMRTETLTLEKIKLFLVEAKDLIRKISVIQN